MKRYDDRATLDYPRTSWGWLRKRSRSQIIDWAMAVDPNGAWADEGGAPPSKAYLLRDIWYAYFEGEATIGTGSAGGLAGKRKAGGMAKLTGEAKRKFLARMAAGRRAAAGGAKPRKRRAGKAAAKPRKRRAAGKAAAKPRKRRAAGKASAIVRGRPVSAGKVGTAKLGKGPVSQQVRALNSVVGQLAHQQASTARVVAAHTVELSQHRRLIGAMGNVLQQRFGTRVAKLPGK